MINNILHIALDAEPIEQGCNKAFSDLAKELGGTYVKIDWCKILKDQGPEALRNIIFKTASEMPRHVCYMQIQTNDLIRPQDIDKIKSERIINWTGDARDTVPTWIID